jgi:hypothetical protein
MDGLEKTTPASVTVAPSPAEMSGPVFVSCCPTATFPPGVVRSWLRDRRVLAGAGLIVVGSGVAFGWDWLAAVGVAPLLVSAAPCLLMCTLGLCMMGRGHQASSGSPDAATGKSATPTDRSASS